VLRTEGLMEKEFLEWDIAFFWASGWFSLEGAA
jgi:hypothetical protein